MITPAELISELTKRGYAASPRKLTEWRSKGLLPPLTDRGLGRGGGKRYYWEQAGIVGHACTVCQLLASHGRTKTAMWALWFLGYDVSTVIVKGLWIERLNKSAPFERDDAGSFPEDKYRESGDRIAAKLFKKDSRLSLDQYENIITPLLASAYESNSYHPDRDTEESLVAGLQSIIGIYVDANKFVPNASDAIRRYLGLYRSFASREQVIRLVTGASVAELEDARQYLMATGRLIAALVPSGVMPAAVRADAAILFGPLILECLLALIRGGQSARLEELRAEMVALEFCLEMPSEKTSVGPEIGPPLARIGGILADFDWAFLYNNWGSRRG